MGLWMDAGVKGKRRVIDSYGFRWEAKEAVDKNECRETTRGIQGGESGAVQEWIRENQSSPLATWGTRINTNNIPASLFIHLLHLSSFVSVTSLSGCCIPCNLSVYYSSYYCTLSSFASECWGDDVATLGEFNFFFFIHLKKKLELRVIVE